MPKLPDFALRIATAAALTFASGCQLLRVSAGPGQPTGRTLRAGRVLATLLFRSESHELDISGRGRGGGKVRYALLLTPIRGGEARVIPLARNVSSAGLHALTGVVSATEERVWVRADENYEVEISSGRVTQLSERQPVPGARPAYLANSEYAPENLRVSGALVTPELWLGLRTPAEAERDFRAGGWVRHTVDAGKTREKRGLYRVAVEPMSDTMSRAVRTEAAGGSAYWDAAFVRSAHGAPALRFAGTGGFLITYASEMGLKGNAMLARLGPTGEIEWTADSGIDRMGLTEILPGEAETVLQGTAPRVPDRVPDPLLVIVDHKTGQVTRRVLWSTDF